ncbi:hypothetical protein SBY92_004621 [Candida maltosa Xu316]|uniref:Pyridoxamine 5'-phosphate oxidase Alr4036 family FMN-binding domain-containing protein n=1 Tax=Candida maltosa (strain Xu316) TaxID=1245528 RepID=M3J6L2_CANMX|nr:hypothetical protein G210_1897 [Candida maltosa Xu316]
MWQYSLQQCIKDELSITNNSPPYVAFQLATIDATSGYPSNRTVVFRGWLFDNIDTSVITFTTDKRMQKYRELLKNDKFEAVFYFSHIKKQFRLRGRAQIIDEDHKPLLSSLASSVSFIPRNSSSDSLSMSYVSPAQDQWKNEISRQWNGLSKNMKKSFVKPTPKDVLNGSNEKLLSSIHRGVDGKHEDYGLKNFAIIGLFVDYVDYCDLDKDRRYIYELDESQQWNEQAVCP